MDEKISWEGHLAGFVSGAILGFCFRESVAKPPKYVWEAEDYNEEDDPFMRQFDEHGNFMEFPKEVEENTTKVVYHFKKEDSDQSKR